MQVTIQRYEQHPKEKTWIQSYQLPFAADGTHTVMDALDYISRNLDASISYYRHSVCGQGICGRCGVKVNGTVKLACVFSIEQDEIMLEPKNSRVIKDLVTG